MKKTSLRNRLSIEKHHILVVFIFFLVYSLIQYGWRFRNVHFYDLPSFFTAAKAVFVHGISPYDPSCLQELLKTAEFVLPYLYPPQSLLLFWPFSLMSYNAVAMLMVLVNHFVFGFLVIFIPIKLFMKYMYKNESMILLIILYMYMYYPFQDNVRYGQITIIVTACICLFWYLYKSKRNKFIAAFFLSLSVLLKTYPVLLLLYLLIKKNYKTLINFSGILAAITILSYFVLPVEIWSEWLTKIVPSGGYGKFPEGLHTPAAEHNQNINAFFSRLFQPNSYIPVVYENALLAKILTYICSAAVFLTSFIAVSRSNPRFSDRQIRTDMDISIILLVIFLIAPFSWAHHLIMLLPVCVFVIILLMHDAIENKYKKMILIVSLLVIALPPTYYTDFLKNPKFSLLISTKFFSVLSIWLILVRERFKGEKESTHSPEIRELKSESAAVKLSKTEH